LSLIGSEILNLYLDFLGEILNLV